MEVEISVVVPVYNAGKTLERCIKSLISQSTDWLYEIILVNDGSTDDSWLLMKHLEKRDSHIVIINKENGGVSTARNAGLNIAQGRYVTFVDSDDYVSLDYLQNMRKEILNDGAGLVIGGIIHHLNVGSVKMKNQSDGLYMPTDFHRMIDDRNICHYGYCVAKLFDMTVIRDCNVLFCNRIHFSEDLLFLLQYLKYAKWVKFTSVVDYNYCEANGVSLVKRYNSFDSEWLGYSLFKGLLSDLQIQYNIENGELEKSQSWLFYFAMRAIKTMYRPGKFKLSRKIRLQCLQTRFSDSDFIFIKSKGKGSRLEDRIVSGLLGLKMYRTVDSFLTVFFALRYSKLIFLFR